MRKLTIELSNICFVFVPILMRFEYSFISFLVVRMCQNMDKGPKSVSGTTSRVTDSLLWALVPKGNGGHGITHG